MLVLAFISTVNLFTDLSVVVRTLITLECRLGVLQDSIRFVRKPKSPMPLNCEKSILGYGENLCAQSLLPVLG